METQKIIILTEKLMQFRMANKNIKGHNKQTTKYHPNKLSANNVFEIGL